ncbi:ABC transporter ATP-binding protein [Couchioplanes caeruleus subsp. azureus]|uniref:ABC transporter ATP-binding protein n=1 Tax=Couchioplanes caeruleus TaxID=56438 RepID=UPI00360A7C45
MLRARRYRLLLRYPRAQRARLSVLAALTALSAALTAVQPLPLQVLVDNGLSGRPPAGAAGAAFTALGLGGSAASIVLAAAVLTGVTAVLATAVHAVTAWLVETTGLRLTRAVAVDLVDRLQRRSAGFHATRPAGDLMSRVGTDSYAVYAATHALLVGPLLHILTLAAVGLAAWRLNAVLTGVLFAAAPLLALVAHVLGARVKGRALGFRRAQSALVAFVTQVLHALPVVQAYTAEDRNLRAMRDRVDGAVSAGRRAATAETVSESVGGLLSAAAVATVLLVGGHQVLRGRLTVGSLLVFLVYARTIEAEARGLLQLQRDVRVAQAGLDRVLEVLEPAQDVPEPHHPVPLPAAGRGAALDFDQVTFGYQPGRPVLHDITLHIDPGETIALVGPTGAGKSTLAALIPRFLDPWTGHIHYNGTDIRHTRLHQLRTRISIVRQQPLLLPLSIADNIAYGRPDATHHDIEHAARQAHAHDFIQALPHGYDTILGEHGTTLSGGQQQRLAIARALLKDAPVLILDEPTAALDPESEALLVPALTHATTGRTVLIIAHRLSTVRHADRIIVLDNGHITEHGTHTQLLTAGGTYARYHHLHLEATP